MSASFLYSWVAFTAASFFLLCTDANGARLSIVGVDVTQGINSVSILGESDQAASSWLASRTVFASDIEVVNNYVYLAEYKGAIQKYTIDGVFSRSLPNLSLLAGERARSQHLGADASGSIYSAFSGSSGVPRNSYRLDADGQILVKYFHRDLDYPNGIDAARNGDVYIVNGSQLGAGRRLYRFKGDGNFVASYPVPQLQHISTLEIDETRNRLYLHGSNGDSIYAYDISAGAPVFTGKLKALQGILGIAVEPKSGRLFGAYGADVVEIALDSSGVTTFATNSTAFQAVAVVVPEPVSIAMALPLFLSIYWPRQIRKPPRMFRQCPPPAPGRYSRDAD